MRNAGLPILIIGFFAVQLSFAQDQSSDSFVLSGQLLLDNGQPPQEAVPVMLTCSGVVYQQVYSQSGGQFSFYLVDNKTPGSDFTHSAGSPSGGGYKTFNQFGRGMGDTGAWGSGRSKAGRLNLSDCEVSAVLPGYLSQVIYPNKRDRMDSPDLGTLTLFPLQKTTDAVVSVELLAAPKKAREAYEKAQEALGKGKVDEAKDKLLTAVEQHPSFGMAWHQLGQISTSQGNRQEAKEYFEAAIKADPRRVPAYCALAQLLLSEDQQDRALDRLEEALRVDPKPGCAAYLYAYASFQKGDLLTAEEYARSVQEGPESQSYAGTFYLLGTILGRQRSYREAADQLRQFLRASPGSVEGDRIRARLAAWRKMGLIEKASSAGD